MTDDLLLFILSSPSGAGKTTLSQRLLRDFPDLTFSVSHTTRRPRANEVHGQDYYFTDEETFLGMVADGMFAEWAEVHGNYYGTSVNELDRARREHRRGILFDVDYQGARQIKAKFPEAVGIFILPPSMEELERRLRGRASDDAATIARRFAKAREEIEHYPFFDYMVTNDELQRALAELEGIVHAERCRRHRMAPRAEALLRH
ncbi:MAG: guanylate kinase [Polyangiales bacterium]